MGISNPDNLSRLGKYIIIGEDTSNHQNDAVWTWEPTTGELKRIATTPFGSESTGIGLNANMDGFSYLTLVTQHPYGETDEDQVDKASNPYSDGPEGYIGYWAFPASLKANELSFGEVNVPDTQEAKSALEVAPIMKGVKAEEGTGGDTAGASSAGPTIFAAKLVSIVAAVSLLFL